MVMPLSCRIGRLVAAAAVRTVAGNSKGRTRRMSTPDSAIGIMNRGITPRNWAVRSWRDMFSVMK